MWYGVRAILRTLSNPQGAYRVRKIASALVARGENFAHDFAHPTIPPQCRLWGNSDGAERRRSSIYFRVAPESRREFDPVSQSARILGVQYYLQILQNELRKSQ